MKQYKTDWVTKSDIWLTTIDSFSVYQCHEKDYFAAGKIFGPTDSNVWVLVGGNTNTDSEVPELTEAVAFVKAHYNLSQ